jgi:hypothetical protein
VRQFHGDGLTGLVCEAATIRQRRREACQDRRLQHRISDYRSGGRGLPEGQEGHAVKVTVGISGTGGGFKKFCRGETDISNASRPILKKEMEDCAKAGIKYIELPVAF